MYVPWSQSVTLFPVIEPGTLMASQSLLACVQHMGHRPASENLVQDRRDAVANLRSRDRRRPFFSPAGFPSPETTWRVTKACDEGASPSNCGPHNPPSRPRACCAGGIPRCDVRLWPPGRTPTAASQARRWTATHPLSPPVGCLGPGTASPPPSPRRLVDAEACATPHGV